MPQSLADEVLQEFANEQLEVVINSAERPSELVDVAKLFTDYLEWRIHGFEFGGRVTDGLISYRGLDKEALYKRVSQIALHLIKMGRQTGRRYDINDLNTPQEIALIQSGRGEEGFKVDSEPYQPMILRDEPKRKDSSIDIANVNIENLNRQRKILGRDVAFGFYFGLGDDIIKISLEPLDEKGRTIQDPLPLDEQLIPITVYTKSDNFPYRRG